MPREYVERCNGRARYGFPQSLEPFTGGKLFDTVFTRGMALVEETAAYLDGPGRDQSKNLSREAGLTYAAWSMELTTRLMQAASWLVMQKAVRDGDMRREDAGARKYRIRRDEPALDPAMQEGRGLPRASSNSSGAPRPCSSRSAAWMRRSISLRAPPAPPTLFLNRWRPCRKPPKPAPSIP